MSIQRASGGAFAIMSRQMAAASFGLPSCSAARPRKKRDLSSFGVERQRALERGLGVGGDNAAGGSGERFAEIGFAFGAGAENAQYIAAAR